MQFQNHKDKIIIIDFGSQLTKLIARRVRDLGVFSEIITISEMHEITDYTNIKGIILSGGPATVTKKFFPSIPKEIFLKKNSYSRNMLWFATNIKIIWRNNKIFTKKKRVWKGYYF